MEQTTLEPAGEACEKPRVDPLRRAGERQAPRSTDNLLDSVHTNRQKWRLPGRPVPGFLPWPNPMGSFRRPLSRVFHWRATVVEYVGGNESREEMAKCIKDASGAVLYRGKVATSPEANFEVLRLHCACPERIVLETET